MSKKKFIKLIHTFNSKNNGLSILQLPMLICLYKLYNINNILLLGGNFIIFNILMDNSIKSITPEMNVSIPSLAQLPNQVRQEF